MDSLEGMIFGAPIFVRGPEDQPLVLVHSRERSTKILTGLDNVEQPLEYHTFRPPLCHLNVYTIYVDE